MLFQIASSRKTGLKLASGQAWARRARRTAPPPDFTASIKAPGASIIAEVKLASPSKGRLREFREVPYLVRSYEAGGARAISVLAEPHYFQGGGEVVSLVRSLTALPILWKDFVISPLQVFEAKARGAAAILLIARILEQRKLQGLIRLANSLELKPLVEVHSSEELGKLRGVRDPFLLGINNRNLNTLEVDPKTTLALLPEAQQLRAEGIISESGIRTSREIEAFGALGVDGFLIGEALLEAADPKLRLLQLRGDGDVG